MQLPAPPTLGVQIDRFGRPGINTALTDPFWDDGAQTVEQHHARQDAYNASSDPAAWASLVLDTAQNKMVLQRFQSYLAVYDSLDGNSDGVATTGTSTGCATSSPSIRRRATRRSRPCSPTTASG